jgi:hypothetical protein
MADQFEIAAVYDEWVRTLSPQQRAVCHRAIRNAACSLRNIGEASAKELLVAILLFCDEKDKKQMRSG